LVVFLITPVFASAQTTSTQSQLTQQLIQLLTQMITQLEQEIQQILAQRSPTVKTIPIVNVTANGSQGPIVTIQSGSNVNIAWNSNNSDSCTFNLKADMPASGSAIFTPTANTIYTVTCSNSYGLGSGSITVNVAPTASSTQPSIIVNQLNGGQSLTEGQTYAINWQAYNLPDSQHAKVSIDLINPTTNNTVSHIGWVLASSGSYSWALPPNVTNAGFIMPGSYKILISYGAGNSDVKGYSNITIINPITNTSNSNPNPSVTVTSPNGGETLVVGKPFNITWNSTGFSPSDNVYISLFNSTLSCAPGMVGCWTLFGLGGMKKITNSGSFTWDTNTYYGDAGPGVPFYLSDKVSSGVVYKIMIQINGSNNITAGGSSTNYFSIIKP
jgi:type II secretory pathway component PulJ